MSFTDRLLLWFHIGFVIFAIGPVTIATMSTPRYIRARNVGVLRYLSRMTRIFGAASLGVLLFGIIAGQSLHDMSKTWVTASITLFVVALVLLVLIMRDQHKAIVAVEGSLAAAPGDNTGQAPAMAATASSAAGGPEPTAADVEPAPAEEPVSGTASAGSATAARLHVATVERGRIASLAGVVSLIWLVILMLMVWRP
jgi:predicted lipid-binding transport protein (Tim44 family)